MTGHTQKHGIIRTLIDNSFLLIAGTLFALLWANGALNLNSLPEGLRLTPEQYIDFIEFDLAGGAEDVHEESSQVAEDHESGGHHGLTIHFIINDIFMALFFAIAAKEVWESMLPGGALSNPRKAATPLLATFGGIAGPALVYLGGCLLTGQMSVFADGWAVPCATDIAFSYLIARVIFGNGHPAIAFLLLLAIADDAAGLIILAVAYPQAPVEVKWFLLTAAAMILAMFFKRARIQSHWAYLIGPGVMSWFSFYEANIHAALGLVPIIPFIPHAHTDLCIFAK